jgi:hypothetical protein
MLQVRRPLVVTTWGLYHSYGRSLGKDEALSLDGIGFSHGFVQRNPNDANPFTTTVVLGRLYPFMVLSRVNPEFKIVLSTLTRSHHVTPRKVKVCSSNGRPAPNLNSQVEFWQYLGSVC